MKPYPGQVFETTHEGHWGWRTSDMLGTTAPLEPAGAGSGTLPAWLASYDADTVFLLLGVNDIRLGDGTTVAATATNMRANVNLLLADHPPVKIYLASVLPATSSFVLATKLLELNVKYRKIAGEYPPVTYVDIHPLFDAAAHTYDGVHPNALGEQILANAFHAAAFPPGPASSLTGYDRFEADLANSNAVDGPDATAVNAPLAAVNGGIAGKAMALSFQRHVQHRWREHADRRTRERFRQRQLRSGDRLRRNPARPAPGRECRPHQAHRRRHQPAGELESGR